MKYNLGDLIDYPIGYGAEQKICLAFSNKRKNTCLFIHNKSERGHNGHYRKNQLQTPHRFWIADREATSILG